MKKQFLFRMAFLVLCLWVFSAHAQTRLVNQSTYSLGRPSLLYEYNRALPIGNGNLVYFDNYYNSINSPDNEDFQLGVLNIDTGPVNIVDYFSLHGGSYPTFGTNMSVHGNYIYACAFTTDSTFTNKTLCNIFKLDLNGDTIWVIGENIDSSLQQVPFVVLSDDSGVYMGASVKTAAGNYKITVIKYDQNGGRLWRNDMDTTLPALPVAMALSGSYLTVTGFEYDNMGNSNFLTYHVNRHTGIGEPPKLTANGVGAISHPCGLVTDTLTRNYIAGTSTVSGINSVIKLIAYDSAFNLLYENTWGDSSKPNQATSMSGDNTQPHVYVTGSSPNASGGNDLVVLKFNTVDGTLAWSRRLSAPNPAYGTGGVSITSGQDLSAYVTGWVFNGVDTNTIVAAIDSGGNTLWMKTFARTSTSTDVPYSISMGDNGMSVNVTLRSIGPDSQYVMLHFDQYIKNNTLATTISGGQYMDNQLIIRFDKSAVNQDAVNNIDIDVADPSYWLTPYADSLLQAVAPFDLSTCKMERIYKGLKASYKYSIARNGDTIPITDTWAAFLLIHPYAGKGTETDVAFSFNELFPMVVHTGLNYVGQFTSCSNNNPHPTEWNINDPYYGGTIAQQDNLWDDTSFLFCSGHYNINIDSAWRLEKGKPFIKVGIYDTGLDGLNADFCPVIPGIQTTKAYGWDFSNNVSLPATNWVNADNPSEAHGTWTTGIVGAIRNNGVGIAGIAGGNWSPTDTNNFGVTLYGMKISRDTVYPNTSSSVNVITLPISDLCNALTVGCSYIPGSNYGYGLHVINNSWGLMTDSTAQATSFQGRSISDAEVRELGVAFKNVYRNQTAIVAAAGNTLNQAIYPANFYNDWIICVGGANDSGNYYYNPSHAVLYNNSFVGPCVDLIAPSATESGDGYYITTTDFHNTTGPIGPVFGVYTTALGGTSTAAPHATGTIALLMSYLDSTSSAYKNLSPEDAEHLLIRNADNHGYVGHSDSTGWGALNAGRSLQDVNQACKVLMHSVRMDTNITITRVAQSVRIKLTERYTNPLTGITYDTLSNDTTRYLCDVYKSTQTNAQNLASNYMIEDAWTRPSTTSLLLPYDSVTNTLQPYEHLSIDNMSNASADISGYFYILLSPDTSSFIGYWGTDSFIYNTNFDYTLLLRDNSRNCYPIDTTTTHIRQLENQMQVSFYPNPVLDDGLLQIFADANTNTSIQLVDQQGRKLQTIYTGDLLGGETSFDISTKGLSSGIYFIVIRSEINKRTIKFTKL